MAKNKLFQDLEEFKDKLAFNSKLGLDDRDTTIIALLQSNPHVSQEEIAQKIKLSQPSVGARIKKLREKGIINVVNGVNFKSVDLYLAKIDVTSTEPKELLKDFGHCPFFINALVTSGKYNLCLFFMSTDLKRLEGIMNYHLRNNPKVKDIELNIVIGTEKDFILPLNINYEDKKQIMCRQDCLECGCGK